MTPGSAGLLAGHLRKKASSQSGAQYVCILPMSECCVGGLHAIYDGIIQKDPGVLAEKADSNQIAEFHNI